MSPDEIDHRREHDCGDDRNNRCDATTRRDGQQQPKADRVDQRGRRRWVHHGRIHTPERLDEHSVNRRGERARPKQKHQEHDQRQQRAKNEWPERLEERASAFERGGAAVLPFAPNQRTKQRPQRQQETDHLAEAGPCDRHRERAKNKRQHHRDECGAGSSACRHAIRLRSKARRDQSDAATNR